MSEIKQILDEIASYSGKNDKRDCLTKYKDNELLKRVIYLAHSPRVNFYIKQIPTYTALREITGRSNFTCKSLEDVLGGLDKLSSRELTGDDARNHLKEILELLSNDDAYVIERIIDKNLKIGMSTGINKVIPKLIEATPYMGAKSFSEKGAKKLFGKRKDKSGKMKLVASQIKADGTYRNAIIKGGKVELCSRQGEVSYLTKATFLEELKQFDDCVLNGELTIDGFTRIEANGMVNSIMDIIEKSEERGKKTTLAKIAGFEEKHGSFKGALAKMRFTVWDTITIDEYYEAKSDTPYTDRFDNLKKLISKVDAKMVDVVETRFITTFAEAMEHFLDAQERGLEGTIIKSITDGWKDGKPTYQIKMKLEMNIDLRIVGFNYGTVGTKNEHVISTLVCESECGLLKTNPSGMKEAMMADVTARQDELLGAVVEIRCCGLSQNSDGDWSTQHPSVVELREDKDTCDSLKSAQEIEEMCKTLELV
jgi:ATP-dependent DNA ligase